MTRTAEDIREEFDPHAVAWLRSRYEEAASYALDGTLIARRGELVQGLVDWLGAPSESVHKEV